MVDILSTYYKCTPSAITQKLNVSGHMSICIFFLVLVCGTHAQSLSATLLHPVESAVSSIPEGVRIYSVKNICLSNESAEFFITVVDSLHQYYVGQYPLSMVYLIHMVFQELILFPTSARSPSQ